MTTTPTATRRIALRRPGLRIDKWLWCARFFKTRGLAQDAVDGGHVQVNGDRVKASRHVKVGDRLRINRERELFEIDVDRHPEASRPGRRGAAALSRDTGKRSGAGARARAESACGAGLRRPPRQA